MMHWGNHMGAGGWISSILGTLIIIGLILAVIVWAVSPRGDRSGSATGAATGASGSAREILDRRLADGELTAEQYEQLRETLGDAAPSSGDPRPRTPAGAPG
jgi:putative membrane protein